MWIVRGRDSFEASFSVFFRLTAACCILFLSACGGSTLGGGSPAPPTPTPPPSPASGSEFLYQFSFLSAIEVSTLNTSTGALSAPKEAIPLADFEDMGLPVVATPSGKFLYEEGFFQSPSVGSPRSAIWGFSITGSDGTLTSLPYMPAAQSLSGLGFTPNGMVMDPKGDFIFVSVYDGVNVSDQSQNTILTFAIDPSTGALTSSSTLSAPSKGNIIVQAVDPSGKYLYASNSSPNGPAISVYAISSTSGALTEIAGSPFLFNPPVGIQSDLSVIPAPSGEFVYAVVTDGTTTPPVVFSFSVSPTTNALAVVSSSPLPVGSPESIALSSTGNFLFLASPGNNLTVFGADASSGTISPTPLSQIPLQDYRGRVLIDPTGQFLIFNNGENTALSYKIDGATGALTPVSGSPFTTGANLTSTLIVGIP
jgi:6-phosphogluconolactonase